MLREDFSDRSSVLILISVVVVSLVYNFFAGKTEQPDVITTMIFPAYEVAEDNPHMKNINTAMPFAAEVDWPEGWRVTTDQGDANWPAGEIYTPYYIYDGETPVAYAGFNVFDSEEEFNYDWYYQTVWPGMRLSSMYRWDPFYPVLNGHTSQIGVIDIDYVDYTQIENYSSMAEVPHIQTVGILAYDIGFKSYFGIAFMPGVMTQEQAIELAKTVRMRSQ